MPVHGVFNLCHKQKKLVAYPESDRYKLKKRPLRTKPLDHIKQCLNDPVSVYVVNVITGCPVRILCTEASACVACQFVSLFWTDFLFFIRGRFLKSSTITENLETGSTSMPETIAFNTVSISFKK